MQNSHLRPYKTPLWKRLLLIFAVAVFGLTLFLTTVFYIFPLHIAEERLKDGLLANGIVLAEGRIGRVFPFGVEAYDVIISDASGGGEIVRLESARAAISLSALLTGRLSLNFSARLFGGEASGRARVRLKGVEAAARIKGMEFRRIRQLKSAGVELGGAFDGEVSLSVPGPGGCPEGSVRMKSGGFKGEGLRFMGFPLPAGDIDDAGLIASVKGCKVELEGLWLEGRDISARLHGEVILRRPAGASPVMMTLEVTPKGELLGKGFLLSFIGAFRKSANYYSIPVRGTLGSPVAG